MSRTMSQFVVEMLFGKLPPTYPKKLLFHIFCSVMSAKFMLTFIFLSETIIMLSYVSCLYQIYVIVFCCLFKRLLQTHSPYNNRKDKNIVLILPVKYLSKWNQHHRLKHYKNYCKKLIHVNIIIKHTDHKLTLLMCNKLSQQVQILEYRRQNEL